MSSHTPSQTTLSREFTQIRFHWPLCGTHRLSFSASPDSTIRFVAVQEVGSLSRRWPNVWTLVRSYVSSRKVHGRNLERAQDIICTERGMKRAVTYRLRQFRCSPVTRALPYYRFVVRWINPSTWLSCRRSSRPFRLMRRRSDFWNMLNARWCATLWIHCAARQPAFSGRIPLDVLWPSVPLSQSAAGGSSDIQIT